MSPTVLYVCPGVEVPAAEVPAAEWDGPTPTVFPATGPRRRVDVEQLYADARGTTPQLLDFAELARRLGPLF